MKPVGLLLMCFSLTLSLLALNPGFQGGYTELVVELPARCLPEEGTRTLFRVYDKRQGDYASNDYCGGLASPRFC